MCKTVWLANPWIYIKKLINKIKANFKPKPTYTIWLDNPWVHLDTAIEKIHNFLIKN